MNDESEKMCKEALVLCLKKFSQHLSGHTEIKLKENRKFHDNSSHDRGNQII